jgi:hypothetical protein
VYRPITLPTTDLHTDVLAPVAARGVRKPSDRALGRIDEQPLLATASVLSPMPVTTVPSQDSVSTAVSAAARCPNRSTASSAVQIALILALEVVEACVGDYREQQPAADNSYSRSPDVTRALGVRRRGLE